METPHVFEQVFRKKTGILAVDKPSGVSSHTVVNWARRVFGVRKIGHTGTLDPLASGLLLLLISRDYTKKQSIYLKQDKEYSVTAQLGVTSDTYDIMGHVDSKASWKDCIALDDALILKTLNSYIGTQQQQVPVYSAVKKEGRKLYELALSGEARSIQLPVRKVTLYSISKPTISRNEASKTVHVSFEVACSSGTYVRSLVHDIGISLGCGAVVTSLRRTAIGPILLDQNAVCPHILSSYYLKK